ncbi:hypothetical protein SVIOM74S_09455 [Streptomyces violarus]
MHSRGALVVLSKSDDGRRDTCRARLPHCGLSVLRSDADTVPVRIGREEGQPEPRIMRSRRILTPLDCMSRAMVIAWSSVCTMRIRDSVQLHSACLDVSRGSHASNVVSAEVTIGCRAAEPS